MPEPLIAVAMSGGVDSSVAAAVLVRQGYSVIGLSMQLWDQRRLAGISSERATARCCSLDDVYDARRVAEHLGIPFYVVNFERRFEEQVVAPFLEEYLRGRTPIPCTLCNNFLKFDQLLRFANSVGAARIATGHYARITAGGASGRFELRTGADESKDQTYFLFGLTQEQLAHTVFPIGGMTKDAVRDLARDYGLPVALKPESQEICFVPDGDYAAFIDAYFREKGMTHGAGPGRIVSTNGKELGKHAGTYRYTVGQRRGLGIAAGEPLYVIATNPASQEVVVGTAGELDSQSLMVASVNWISLDGLDAPRRAQVKIRNKHVATPATLRPTGDVTRVKVEFDTPQRAVTPGQAAVFYDGDLVLGGGWIESP